MKKLLALFLLIGITLSLTACGLFKKGPGEDENNENEGTAIEQFAAMFTSSVPTKTVTTATEKFNNQKLTSTVTIATGIVEGKTASVLESRVQTLRALEDGKLDIVDEKVTNEWYVEGKGTSTNKGRKWNAEGTDFAGGINVILKEEYFSSVERVVTETEDKLILVIAEDDPSNPKGYAKQALANFIPQDMEFDYETTITIIATGGRISTVRIEYIVMEHEVGDEYDAITITDMEVAIEVNLSYEPQDITFE